MDSVSRANGGIFEAEKSLQLSLFTHENVDVQVVGLQDANTDSARVEWLPLRPVAHFVRGPHAFGFAPGFLEAMLKADADLAYCAGLWKYPSLASLRWARETNRPMIVAPHGMLDPWAVQNSRTKKRVVGWLFQDAQLRRAVCIRALCKSEHQSIRTYGLRNPVCIVPNGVDLPVVNAKCDTKNSERKTLLFLGRLHPKKGLIPALRAWNKMRKAESGKRNYSEWHFVIAGWDQGGHEAELKRLCGELSLPFADTRDDKSDDRQLPAANCPLPTASPSVLFVGPAFGEEKDALLRSADAFILPSFSEGLPMSVLEAWAYGLPVLMTPECNLPEGFERNAAIRIEVANRPASLDTRRSPLDSPSLISQGLRALFEMSDAERVAMGANGFELVREKFAWPVIGREMAALYTWVLGGGSKPDCVVCR